MFVSRMRLVAVAAMLTAAVPAFAQPPGDKPDMAAAMKEMAKWSTPGEQHKQLEKMAGKWTTELKMWMDPSQPPVTEKGTAEFHMVLGGRYLVQNYKSQMMGMPFEGIGTVGYDIFRQRYFATWMDNMGCGMMTSTGNASPTGEISMTGVMDEPMTGEKDKKVREVIKWTGPDTHTFEMYDTIAGKEVRVMEITHTRVK